MNKGRIIKYLLAIPVIILLLIVAICCGASIWLNPRPDISLEDLMIDTRILPVGWHLISTFSYEPTDDYGAEQSLVMTWGPENKDILTLSASEVVLRYANTPTAFYWYTVLTSEDSWPSEALRPPTSWDYKSPFADQIRAVCSLPNAGSYCLVTARYGQYLVTLRYINDQADSDIKKEFQDLWKQVDAHVGQQLNK